MRDVVKEIKKELKKNADAKTRESGRRFFKEEVKLYGVRAAAVSKIAREYFSEVKRMDKKKMFAVCEELFKSGYSEEAWIAAGWVHKYANYEKSDFPVYERWLDKYIDNWAKCDTFCNHAVGEFVEKYPAYLSKLKIWARSKNLWKRRAAAVSLIIPAKKGKFLKEIFGIADILLLDEEDMVQKGYGWMLKEASRKNEKQVFSYVMEKKKIMPRTALRYAIEKMPENLKKQAMEK
ncbi:MAG: DNA alkylation repair protein [Patescibacteria group bacterium]|jgi:3-methyladenine DNA glycosylase AlkD